MRDQGLGFRGLGFRGVRFMISALTVRFKIQDLRDQVQRIQGKFGVQGLGVKRRPPQSSKAG